MQDPATSKQALFLLQQALGPLAQHQPWAWLLALMQLLREYGLQLVEVGAAYMLLLACLHVLHSTAVSQQLAACQSSRTLSVA